MLLTDSFIPAIKQACEVQKRSNLLKRGKDLSKIP